MTVDGIRVSRRWLALREPADAAARAPDLVESLRPHLTETGPRVIHDLGCGTGAMGRWLAPLLPGPQHWVVHDRDADLLEVAAADLPGPAADGAAVTVEVRQSDITRLPVSSRAVQAALAGEIQFITSGGVANINANVTRRRFRRTDRDAQYFCVQGHREPGD